MSATETGILPTDQGIRVLALDGGGIRGLSSLILLRELMLRISVAAPPTSNTIRPCDYFDLIIGTGTGGLSALFVGRMRMTVDEAIEAYLRLGKEGFRRSALWWFQRLWYWWNNEALFFDGDSLTYAIGDIVQTSVGDRDAPLHDPSQTTATEGRSCRVAVLAATSDHVSAPPHVFRSYRTESAPASPYSIHEVARATTATAGLFPSISLGFPSVKFIDAGVAGYNNPAEEALSEVDRIWPGANITCLVSLGTGIQKIVNVDETWEGVMKVSTRLMEDCGKVHQQLLGREVDGLPYYRFNVTSGLDTAGITEWDEKTSGVIAAVTEGYTRQRDVDGDLKSCVSLLVGKKPANRSPFQLLKAISDAALADKIFKWLNAPDSSPNYNAAYDKYQKGTCTWLINGHGFSQWKRGKGSFLCIYGKPGCGKTVLCSSIINHVANFCQQETSRDYAYFFFDGRDAQTTFQLHDGLIRSLIRQFSERCKGIPAVLVEGYGNGFQQLPIRDLEEILRLILEGFTDAFIIIDSLDECVERVKLLNWISNLSALKAENVHLLVTSRPEGEITRALRSLEPTSISMEEESVDRDIEAYIDAKMKEGWLGTQVEEVRSRVKKVLMTMAQGMFRWLAIQLDELQKCLNVAELYRQLSRLPKDLDETYSRTLARIPEQRQAAARVFLQWTAFSARPPSLEELGEAAAFESDHEGVPKYNPLQKIQASDVLVACACLIIESKGHVRLSHFSVKEYLLSERISSGRVSYFGIGQRLSHSYISQSCLTYLLRFDSPESLNEKTLPDFPLAWYAARYWAFHVQLGDNEKGPGVQNLIMTLLGGRVSLTNWIRLYDPDALGIRPGILNSVKTVPNPLYYASLLGLADVVRGLLDKVPSPDAMHEWNINSAVNGRCTALEAACRRGNVDVVKTLLDRGADVNAMKGSALVRASYSSPIDIIEMLLDSDAEGNGGYGNALVIASLIGRIKTVQTLLHHGAGEEVGNGDTRVLPFDMFEFQMVKTVMFWDGYTNARNKALACASERGHVEIVKILLEYGADVDVKKGEALALAILAGHKDVVKTLLDCGADMDAREGKALALASDRGHVDMVRMLLDYGTDVNAGNSKALVLERDLDDNGSLEMTLGLSVHITRREANALVLASDRGHVEIVQVLLDRDADIDAGDGNALVHASCQGHIEVVKLLLERGADVNVRNGEAFVNASDRGHVEMVKLLLDYNADVNARDGEAFVNASNRGHVEWVKFLLDHGADVNVRDGEALARASGEGYVEMVKLLLDHGGNIDGQGGKALARASDGGSVEMVTLLLDRGANINAGNSKVLPRASGYLGGLGYRHIPGTSKYTEFGNALSHASGQGYIDIVNLLLRRGADVNAGKGEALVHASCQGRVEVVEILLDRDADINAQDGEALVGALRGCHLRTFKVLLDRGADVNAGDGGALVRASEQGYTPIVERLLERGAKVNAQDGKALAKASFYGHTKVVELLLDRDADVNAGNGEALAGASRQGRVEVVKLLLDRGANVHVQGDTALQRASFNGYTVMVKLLLDRGADVNVGDGDILARTSKQGHMEVVNLLLDHGADVNAGEGKALFFAMNNDRMEVFKLLLDRGADINAGEGKALISATYQGRVEVVKKLLEWGADVNAGNGKALVHASGKGQLELVKLLLDRGADINAALANASSNGYTDAVHILLDHGADVNAGNGDAFLSASAQGETEVVKLDLDRGADVNEGDGKALASASTNGHKEII